MIKRLAKNKTVSNTFFSKMQNLDVHSLQELSQFLDFLQYKQNTKSQSKERKIGLLEGKAKVTFSDDFAMSDADLVNMR